MPGQPWGAAVRLEQGGAAAGDGLWPDEGTGKHDVDSREQQEPRGRGTQELRFILAIPRAAADKEDNSRGNFVFLLTFLLKRNMTQSIGVFEQRQESLVCCSKCHLFSVS
jgi:hypothetical protein